MRATCKSALICDMAQFYHIYDIETYSIQYMALLACGLPADSRTIRKLTGQKLTLEQYLMAGILDSLQEANYLTLKKSFKGRHEPPRSVLAQLTGADEDESNEVRGFKSADDFERAKARIING